jgi:6-phosphogluconate dehydrogenase
MKKEEKMQKEIGYIGLGKMGTNMVLRLLGAGWKVIAYNPSRAKVEAVVEKGAVGSESLADLVSKLPSPRTLWLMVPHEAVDEVIGKLMPLINAGDLIIDGGNSPYRESMRRAEELAKESIEFLDIGVSGGPGGTLNGACMMAGGKKELYERLDNAGFFKDTCVPGGYQYIGKSGAGHFVKMVHNGIEYGMMQSIAEGFDLMRHSSEFNLNPEEITALYSHGSVITSRLVSWMHDGYKKYGKDLNAISGRASALGEGHWTLEAARRENISMPALETALATREASQDKPSYQGKVISTMRGGFGQHPVARGGDEPEIL